VVEVDVGQQQMAHVPELHAARAERIVQGGHAARRAAVEEREAVVGLHEVRGDAARVAAMQQVERLVRHEQTVLVLPVPWRWRRRCSFGRER
jgi:hypothetical protein